MRLLGFALITFLVAFSGLAADAPATATASSTPPGPGAGTTGGSTGKPLDLAKTNEFPPLFEERDLLSTEIAALDALINDISEEITRFPSRVTLVEGVASAKKELAKETNRKVQVQDPERISVLEQNLKDAESDLARLKTAREELNENRDKRDVKVHRLSRVEQRIASLFDASKDINKFRSNVTYTFGVLVLFVIAGFYYISQKQEEIARTIFSGEMGMQFVTLFLIVIAIILFGIMGTLEGRELAALLGGLSGYILGRSSQQRTVPQETQKETAGAAVP